MWPFNETSFPPELPLCDMVASDFSGLSLYAPREEHASYLEDFRSIGWRSTIGKWIEAAYAERANALCPYCGSHMIEDAFEERWPDGEELDEFQCARIWNCRYCAYWRLYMFYDSLEDPTSGQVDDFELYFLSKLREYSSSLPEGVNSEFAQLLRRNPSIWHTMSPTRFEELVAEVFRQNFAPCEAIHVGGSHDGGRDVIFVDSEKQQWLIQAKRRESPNRGEEVDTVRNLLGVMVDYDALHGIVVSTADHFSYQAEQFANRQSKRGYVIGLVDRGKLNRMLQPLLPMPTWPKILDELFPQALDGLYGRQNRDHPGQTFFSFL